MNLYFGGGWGVLCSPATISVSVVILPQLLSQKMDEAEQVTIYDALNFCIVLHVYGWKQITGLSFKAGKEAFVKAQCGKLFVRLLVSFLN